MTPKKAKKPRVVRVAECKPDQYPEIVLFVELTPAVRSALKKAKVL